jgi:hypothetical protein
VTTLSFKIDFYGSSASNKAVKAIGLEVDVGGLGSKMSLSMFPEKVEIVFLSLA